MFCILDDAKTAAGDRRVQWVMPLGAAQPVRAWERPKKASGLLSVGSRSNWLYSRRLHPDPAELKATIENLVEAARNS